MRGEHLRSFAHGRSSRGQEGAWLSAASRGTQPSGARKTPSMSKFERVREPMNGTIDPEHMRRRQLAGWHIVAVEWERETGEVEAAPPYELPQPTQREIHLALEEAPYGTHVAADCARLEDDPAEMQFLLSLMELIIQDISISKVAEELNRKGFRTRRGTEWGPVGVFNLLPRLIELTPKIFATEEWIERRKRFTPVY